MRVIDARSGHEVKIGQTIDWGDGESITLLDVDPGIFSASAIVRITHRDYSRTIDLGKAYVTITREVPLRVRWTHPAFFLQHVAFLDS